MTDTGRHRYHDRLLAALAGAGLSGFAISRAIGASGEANETGGRNDAPLAPLYPSLHALEARGRIVANWEPTAAGIRRVYRRVERRWWRAAL